MAEMKVIIDGFGLFEYLSPVFKELWADERINGLVKEEYKTRFTEAVIEWANNEKMRNFTN